MRKQLANACPVRGVCAALLLLLLASPASTQVVRGTLVDAETRQPVAVGEVSLLRGDRAAGSPVVTDTLGRFVLRAPDPGTYRVRAARVGYHTSTSDPLTLRNADTVEVELRVSTSAVVLAPLSVTAARRDVSRRTALDDFLDRQRRGHGRFITPEEIARRRPMRVSELFRGTPSVRLMYGAGKTHVLVRGMLGYCTPTLFIDNVEMPLDADFTLDDVVPLLAVRAIEVHTGASVPARYQRGGCGTILIWTTMLIPEGGAPD